MSGAPTTDVHAHLGLRAVEELVAGRPELAAHRELEARRNGPESLAVSGRMVAERLPLLGSPTLRLERMDAAGVDVQVLSPSPAHYHYWADRHLAVEVAQAANTAVAAAVAAAPTRLTGLGLVPLQHPDLAVAALEDAVARGLRGIEVSSFAPDPAGGTIELSDPRLEDLWARAAQLGAVVFLHPFGCSLDERLDRWYLSNTVGQPVENAVALSHLVFAGVLDRHPGLRLLAAHGGGYLPTFLGRSDHAWEVRPDARACTQPPSSYLRRMWFDSLVHAPGALRALVDAVGADRVCLGSDFPFDMGVEDPVDRLRAAQLGPDAEEAVRGGNAAALGLLPGLAGVPVPAGR